MYSRKTVFAAACMGMLVFGIVLISLGSILPSVTKRFFLDEIDAGTLASILPFGILVGSLIFGPIVDKYGYKNLLIVCTVLVLAGLEGIAFASTVFMLHVSVFLIGFGGGVINGGTNALVSDITTEGKGASLSLLGVFFGIGALGMPAILGILSKSFSEAAIISWVGAFVALPLMFFAAVKFPVPKQPQGLPIKDGLKLIKDPVLVMLGFLLFFESGMEGIVNNWTTTYLQHDLLSDPQQALFALTYFVAGMTVTRLLLGSLLKRVPAYRILYGCLTAALVGTIILMNSSAMTAAVIGLIILGIGFAAGFPVVLGYVGDIYSNLSGTAFSIVLVIGLVGNMLINYIVGLVSHSFGIKHFTTILIIAVILMMILLKIVLDKIKAKTAI